MDGCHNPLLWNANASTGTMKKCGIKRMKMRRRESRKGEEKEDGNGRRRWKRKKERK